MERLGNCVFCVFAALGLFVAFIATVWWGVQFLFWVSYYFVKGICLFVTETIKFAQSVIGSDL